MKIPKLTEENPYIEFRITQKGKIILKSHPKSTWGGINSGFISSNREVGNVCDKPNQLNKYIKVRVTKEIRRIDKEISKLLKKREKFKNILHKFYF